VRETTSRRETGQTGPSGWRHYPFDLVPDDPEFVFPAAEGVHPRFDSDSWFIAGELTATLSRRKFAFLTIFNRIRPGEEVVADFYTFALFDIDNADYATYTDYDMPPASMAAGVVPKMIAAIGHLELIYDSGAGRAEWITSRGSDTQLLPYTYDLVLVGIDSDSKRMDLRLHVEPTQPPVPVGADVLNGRFAHLGQPDTFSYLQTGMTLTGTLKWGDIDEQVTGAAGHIDRQWFPLPAGGDGAQGALRAVSHEWRTIHLDNGVDLIAWRQFDRRHGNALLPFTGATVTFSKPGAQARCVEDIAVDTTGYVRWPESIPQLIPPPAAGRYLPDRHTLTSAALDLELTCEPLVPLPAHALPIEYMEGPAHFHGTMGGLPVSGFGIWERSLALYRDWELVDVLATTVAAHTPAADSSTPLVVALTKLVTDGQQQQAFEYLRASVRPDVERLPAEIRGEIAQIVDDLAVALSRG
jgi:hypothetical protein